MANYIIIGGDQKEYGPVAEADIRQWLAEGRLNGQSLAKAEGDAEFRPLAQFPELAAAFRATAPATIAPLKSAPDFSAQDYDLDIIGCIVRGWELVKNHLGLLFVGPLLYALIQGALGGLASIPLVGVIFSIGNLIISGPLLGGLFYLFIRVKRGEAAELGDLFSGFRRAFGQLLLGTLVPALLLGLCLLPFIIIMVAKFIPLAMQLKDLQPGTLPDPTTLAALKSAIFSSVPALLLCAIPATYLGVCWKFTLPLIVDQQMDFATAMKTSWRRVNKHWWQVFGLVVMTGMLNIAGMLACCVGVLLTMPIGMAALMIAYETLFNPEKE